MTLKRMGVTQSETNIKGYTQSETNIKRGLERSNEWASRGLVA
jgi:hypothetical protein